MKYKNKNQRRYYRRRTNKNMHNSLKRTNKFINDIQMKNKYKKCHVTKVREPGSMQYLFYAILNTDLHMNRGTAAANIANGLIFLHHKLDCDQVKCQYIDHWTRHGQAIIILKGYDHKHLKYLQGELKFLAIGTHAVQQSWGRNKAIVVLAVFGLKEDLDEVFEGLTYLR